MSTNTDIKEKLIDYHKYLMTEIESYGSSLYPADYDRGAFDALTDAAERLYDEFLRDVPTVNLYE